MIIFDNAKLLQAKKNYKSNVIHMHRNASKPDETLLSAAGQNIMIVAQRVS
jgi:hypothetical protein